MFAIHMDLWIFWNLLCNFLGTGLAQQHENPYARIFAACFLWGIWPHLIADRAKEEWLSICVPCCWLCNYVRVVETGFLPRFTHLYFLTSPCVWRGARKVIEEEGVYRETPRWNQVCTSFRKQRKDCSVCVLRRDELSVSLVCWRFRSTCGGQGPLCIVPGPVGKSDVRKMSLLLQELKV